MLLFVGLGNPGPEYSRNRHNIGFMAVDGIAKYHYFTPWRRRFSGAVAEGALADERILLLVPETFMNESGHSVGEALRFNPFNPSQIVVFHDDIELPFGMLKVKVNGGNAGHNGLRSISNIVGNDFRRVRFGVGRPPDNVPVDQYVLSDFAKYEFDWMSTMIEIASENIAMLVKHHDATFEQTVNSAMMAKGFKVGPRRRK